MGPGGSGGPVPSEEGCTDGRRVVRVLPGTYHPLGDQGRSRNVTGEFGESTSQGDRVFVRSTHGKKGKEEGRGRDCRVLYPLSYTPSLPGWS